MREARLRELLRQVEVPDAAEAERRGLAMIEAAHGELPRPARRGALPRAAVALAAAGLLAVLLLSPAGAAVRGWLGDVFTAGVPTAQPGLRRLPGGGRLLVETPSGPWVVNSGGERRLLGRYGEASWSPHGLFLAAASGRTLTAIEPDGTPHWSLSAPGRVREPRWSAAGCPTECRIAFRAASELWVVAADGNGAKPLARGVANVAPAWSPLEPRRLAYVDDRGRVAIRDAASGALEGSSKGMPHLAQLDWAGGGRILVEASSREIRARRIEPRAGGAALIGPAHRIRLPGGGLIRDVALAPEGRSAAVLREAGTARAPRASVDLLELRSGAVRRLFGTPGTLGEVAFSPDGRRLLVSWPQADQWLFLPTAGHRRVVALSGIAAAFAPGGRNGGAFPSLAGWCCAANAGG